MLTEKDRKIINDMRSAFLEQHGEDWIQIYYEQSISRNLIEQCLDYMEKIPMFSSVGQPPSPLEIFAMLVLKQAALDA